MAEDFDFADTPISESTAISVPGDMPREPDIGSFEVRLDQDYSLGRAIFSKIIPQREWLDPSAPPSLRNAASVGNIQKVREELAQHLKEAPCLVIHCGDMEYDFPAIRNFAVELTRSTDGDIPVAFCATNARGDYVIQPEAIPEKLLAGCSVFYYLVSYPDAAQLSKQLSIFAELARSRMMDISPMRLIVVLDKAMTYAISRIIRSDEDDQDFVFDDSERRKKAPTDLSTQYLPQVEQNSDARPTLVTKSWESRMAGHAFRNAHHPSTALLKPIFPLDHLGAFLAFHPMGQSYVIANMLLPEKGELVKRLLESWVNYTLGSTIRFITAC